MMRSATAWPAVMLARLLNGYPVAVDAGLLWGRLAFWLCRVFAVLHLLLPLVLLYWVIPSQGDEPSLDYGYALLGVMWGALLGFTGFGVLRWGSEKFSEVHVHAPDYVALPLLGAAVRVLGDYWGTMLILTAVLLWAPGVGSMLISVPAISWVMWLLSKSAYWLFMCGVVALFSGRLGHELIKKLFFHIERKI